MENSVVSRHATHHRPEHGIFHLPDLSEPRAVATGSSSPVCIQMKTLKWKMIYGKFRPLPTRNPPPTRTRDFSFSICRTFRAGLAANAVPGDLKSGCAAAHRGKALPFRKGGSQVQAAPREF